MGGAPRFAFTVLAFGYALLYLPIALVIVYSFNESRLVTVWGGFSTKWWSALFANEALLRAAWLSLRIALVSATIAAVIGLAAGYVLARVPRFTGRTLFGSLVVAPMVMPEVVMGISMLLLFVGSDQLMGWPGRGFLTITIAHVMDDLPDDHPAADRAGRRLGLAARLHPLARRSYPDAVRRRRAVRDPAHARLFQCPPGRRPADQCARHHHRGGRRLCADTVKLADAPESLS
jgi:hypothetical protein